MSEEQATSGRPAPAGAGIHQRDVLEAMAPAVCVVEAGGRMVYANPGWRALAEEIFSGRAPGGGEDFFAAPATPSPSTPSPTTDAVAGLRDQVRRVLDGADRMDADHAFEIGERRIWARVRVRRMKSRGRVAAVVSAVDVSEQTEAMHALQARAHRNAVRARMAAYTDDMLLINGPDGRIEWVNESFVRKTGLSPDEVVGRPRTDFITGPFRDSEEYRDLHAALSAVRPALAEFLMPTRDGRSMWVSLRAETPVVADAHVVGQLIVERDVTQLREEESRTRHSLARATSLADELREQSNRLQEQLRDRDAQVHRHRRAYRDFVALASHELRTPLTAVMGYLEMLHEQQATATSLQQGFLEAALRNTARLEHLVDGLLTLNQIDTGDLTLATTLVDVDDVLHAVVAKFLPRAERRGIRIEVRGPGLAAMTDRRRLDQIVEHLLANAVKFTPDGGSIGVSGTVSEDHLTIEVRDTGCGIPPDDLPQVTQRFYRGGTPTGEAPGAGLGLAIVEELAGLMDGSLRLTSVPGQGTTATVELLLVPEPTASSAGPVPDHAS